MDTMYLKEVDSTLRKYKSDLESEIKQWEREALAEVGEIKNSKGELNKGGLAEAEKQRNKVMMMVKVCSLPRPTVRSCEIILNRFSSLHTVYVILITPHHLPVSLSM